MNRMMRRTGYTSREIFHMRDNEDNSTKPVEDKTLADKVEKMRQDSHPTPNAEDADIEIGMNVLIKKDKSKLKPRHEYIQSH